MIGRWLTFLFSALLLNAHAQERNPRTCRILFLGGSDRDPAKLHLFDGTTSREVELPRMNLSPVYELPQGPITLRLSSEPLTPDLAPPANLPSVNVSESAQDIYLLLTPDSKIKPLPIRLQVINASSDQFRTGQMRWFNLTPTTVQGIVGKHRISFGPRSLKTIDAPADNTGTFPVNLYYLNDPKGKPYPLCETSWNHNAEARTLVFIFQTGDARAPRILGFPDHRIAATAATP